MNQMTNARPITSQELETPLTPFAKARDVVINMMKPAHIITTPLIEAMGSTTADDVVSLVSVPPFDNSSMDGHAVRSVDHSEGDGPWNLMSIARIATGMALPKGADAVVPWEEIVETGGQPVIIKAVDAGQNVRRKGHDIAHGASVVAKGTRLDPVHLGALASIGIAAVPVFRAPNVGILISGDELQSPIGAPASDAIYDVNSTLLPLLLAHYGGNVVELRQCGDDAAATELALRSLVANCDIVVTTGGASVGERDWVRATLQEHGEIVMWRVALRPGKPFAAGALDSTPVFCLPGNPGSVLACAHAFVAPAIRAFSGATPLPTTLPGVLAGELSNDGDRTFLCPFRWDANGMAHPLVGETSQSIAHAGGLDGFIAVPPNTTLNAGDTTLLELV